MKFVSKQREFRLIIRPTEVILDESRRPRIQHGERVEFKNHVYFTEDKGLIDYLLHHPLYGLRYTSELGADRVEIQKHSLNFDDGAELTGPKLLAGKSEPPVRSTPKVEMVSGAISTVTHRQAPEVPNEVPKTEYVTKEEMGMFLSLLDSRFDSLIDKIGTISNDSKKAEPKKPKEFHCPVCNEQFSSGIAVGKHKKEAHPS